MTIKKDKVFIEYRVDLICLNRIKLIIYLTLLECIQVISCLFVWKKNLKFHQNLKSVIITAYHYLDLPHLIRGRPFCSKANV